MIMARESCGRDSVVDDTSAFFGDNSPLAGAERVGGRPYEPRPQQAEMAEAVADTFALGRKLCVEAPTGVGKSFAYLVPAIHFARLEKLPVVVSTETINLQEQLCGKDLPLLSALMGVEFSFALAKGRSNYLCKRRLHMSTGGKHQDYLPLASLTPDIERLFEWSETSADGSLSDINFELDQRAWTCVSCEVGNCLGPKCSFFRDCFYWRARKSWEKADVLVTNHALFLSDLKMKQESDLEGGILPQYCGVVIDEAHQLENSAAAHLGARVTEFAINRVLGRLFDQDRGRGLLLREGEAALTLRQLVRNCSDSVQAFFNQVRLKLTGVADPQKRVLKPFFVEDNVTISLAAVERELAAYYQVQEDEDFKLELCTQLNRCRGFKEEIHAFLNMTAPESVYWVERKEGGPRQMVTLNIAPLNVAEILRHALFSQAMPVILTSATLAVGDKLDYYKGRVGFEGDELVLDSPFDYATQATVYVRKNLPDQGAPTYDDALAREIERYVMKTHGKAFVLFTSYGSMLNAAERSKDFLRQHNITQLVQGEGKNRSLMLKEFREDVDSVIYGTTSFWMGVDVPGEALSNVIITKLPFAVPSEPLVEARLDKLKAEGRNSFMDYSLPEAVIRFKQGVGRLIRSKTDRGIIVLLDNRVLAKSYGRIFVNSLPPCPMIIE